MKDMNSTYQIIKLLTTCQYSQGTKCNAIECGVITSELSVVVLYHAIIVLHNETDLMECFHVTLDYKYNLILEYCQ